MLGLPAGVTTCLFDLDGVLTDTASVHGAAWKEMFDAVLRARVERDGVAFVPFDPVHDYETYVDGKPRLAVCATFWLHAVSPCRRALTRTDPPQRRSTVWGAERKQ